MNRTPPARRGGIEAAPLYPRPAVLRAGRHRRARGAAPRGRHLRRRAAFDSKVAPVTAPVRPPVDRAPSRDLVFRSV